MKKNLFTLLMCFLGLAAYSQCNNYYNIKEGVVFEIENYNAKDKKEGRVLNKVSYYRQTGDNFEATIHTTVFDKKDKELHQGEYKMVRNDGVLLIDMSKFIPEEMLKAFEGGEIEVIGDQLEIPSSLSVGQKLNDGNLMVKMATGPGMSMSMNISIDDRKVEGKETIETPAGTFECYKISYNINSKTNMLGMNINNAMRSVDWISLGKGVVKSSVYNNKGSLVGYSLLTKFEE